MIQHFQIAITNFLSAKLRTLLAMLGILVGTASVVALVSSGNLATQQALEQVSSLGTNLISVNIYEGGENSSSSSTQNRLHLSAALNLIHASPNIKVVAPYISIFAPVSFQGKELNAPIIGTVQELKDVINIQLVQGRFISFLDSYSFFCVIGHNIYNQILDIDNSNPLGKQIRIGDKMFTIIGIEKEWPENSFFEQDVNNVILIPIKTSLLVSQYAQINNIVIALKDDSNIDEMQDIISSYINKKVPNKKLFFRSAKQLIESIEKQREVLTLLLGLIGAISLLVGGIGIMNIMLVTVVERRREIGIRRAIGARKRDIQIMFLTEAIILSILGGILGVVVGVAATFIIAYVAKWRFALFWLPPLIGFSVSVLIGVFFGFYPAYQASRLDPIQALHAE